jgi:hypothetical protein
MDRNLNEQNNQYIIMNIINIIKYFASVNKHLACHNITKSLGLYTNGNFSGLIVYYALAIDENKLTVFNYSNYECYLMVNKLLDILILQIYLIIKIKGHCNIMDICNFLQYPSNYDSSAKYWTTHNILKLMIESNMISCNNQMYHVLNNYNYYPKPIQII